MSPGQAAWPLSTCCLPSGREGSPCGSGGGAGLPHPLFVPLSGLPCQVPLSFCFPHHSCTSSGVEATGTRSRWLWAGPLFLPTEEVLLAWAAGHPAQVTSAASGLNGWDLSFQEQRGRRRQQSLALWPWAAVLQSPWVWKFCGMGWGDPMVVQVGAPAGSRPLRGRRAGRVQSACSVLG